jgi:tetratricopeptide (TPR) repeat protein
MRPAPPIFAHTARVLVLSLVGTTLAPTFAYADGPKPAAAPTAETAASAQAHQHAARAHELYQQGQYHEAISELEAALKLDPNGKDLVFNLGVVHEKLGDIEDALRYFERYETMDLDAPERARAETYLKRLQGARKEVEKPAEPPPTPPPAPPPPPEKHYGRFDALTGAAVVVGVAGLAAGTIFGVKALSDRPKTTATTDTNGYAQVESGEASAHNEGVASDVCFLVGIAGVATAAVLFFARTRDSASPPAGSTSPRPAAVVVSGAPLRGGGGLLLQATF